MLSSEIAGIRLDLVTAFFAPDDQPNSTSGGAGAECHRRAGL
jgi:hypothetical protein